MQLFSQSVYIQIYANRFVLKLLEEGAAPVTITADEPFTTQRLLVGQFAVAERTLKQGLKRLFQGRWFAPSPRAVIHPMEMVEGGLSEIEMRVFNELAAGAGAHKVVVWIGPELSNSEAKQQAMGRDRPPL